MLWLEAFAYVWRISTIASPSFCIARRNNRESSTNNKLVTLCAPLQIETPLILSSNSAFVNKAVKPSAHNRNKYGDSGSPCRIPQFLLNGAISHLGILESTNG